MPIGPAYTESGLYNQLPAEFGVKKKIKKVGKAISKGGKKTIKNILWIALTPKP